MQHGNSKSVSLAVAVLALSACDVPGPTSIATSQNATLSAASAPGGPAIVAELGGRIFRDQNLSLNRNQSCQSCHDPAWGFSSPDPSINAAGSVMPGSVSTRFGTRKPPSAAYATPSPVMFFDDIDGTYVGGNFWDGHATGARLGSPSAEQALFPFPGAVEQALPDIACVIHRVRSGSYRGAYQAAWGSSIFNIPLPANIESLCSTDGAVISLSSSVRQQVLLEYDRIGRSIAAFEDSPEVNQFSSKYDAYLKRQVKFTALEEEGLALYEGKAMCAACHPNAGPKALFTDYTYDNIGVPANPQNPALLANSAFQDLGLGGFLNDASFNGAQKVPTLRNLDRRGIPGGAKSYMHNGVFKTLEQVVHFYNTRDVLPNCASVSTPQFGVNCWPAPEVTDNVNVDELGDLGLTPAEEAAVVAYLKTLSDGFLPRVR